MIKYYIGRQKYLEALENNNIQDALSIMRNELLPLNIEEEKIQKLSTLLLFEPNEIYDKAKWSGIKGDTRNSLFNDIYNHLNCEDYFYRGRLHDLIKQSLLYQKSKLPKSFHSKINVNLYNDLECPNYNKNWRTKEILTDHENEVWGISYSYNGNYLASYDSNGIVIIWNVSPQAYNIFKKIEYLKGIPVENIDWNKDNRRILICTKQIIIVYDIVDSQVKMKFTLKNATCSAWIPDKECFVTGDLDGNLNLVEYKENMNNNTSNNTSHQELMEVETDYNIIYTWNISKINDIAISLDGKHITILDQNHSMCCIDIETRSVSKSFFSGYFPISCSISNDNLLLINFTSNETPFIGRLDSQIIKIYDIEKDRVIEEYSGYKQSRYYIRSTFGGDDNQYVLSGSEDSLIYIWYRPLQKFIGKLKGHTSVVNCISWNRYNDTFASCSDDGTIRIWVPQ